MRSAARAYAIDAVLWLAAAAAITVIVVLHPGPVDAVTAAAVAAALVATIRRVRIGRMLRAQAEAERATAAARDAEAAQTRAWLTSDLNAVVVETVAATQGVVRAAYPDDILQRLTTADDALHALLDRIATIGAPTQRAADGPQAAAGPQPEAVAPAHRRAEADETGTPQPAAH